MTTLPTLVTLCARQLQVAKAATQILCVIARGLGNLYNDKWTTTVKGVLISIDTLPLVEGEDV
jgi:hypothetical protein